MVGHLVVCPDSSCADETIFFFNALRHLCACTICRNSKPWCLPPSTAIPGLGRGVTCSLLEPIWGRLRGLLKWTEETEASTSWVNVGAYIVLDYHSPSFCHTVRCLFYDRDMTGNKGRMNDMRGPFSFVSVAFPSECAPLLERSLVTGALLWKGLSLKVRSRQECWTVSFHLCNNSFLRLKWGGLWGSF